MKKTIVFDHLTANELRNKMNESQSRQQFQRWQVIYLALTRNYPTEEIAGIVGISPGTVHQWVHLYNHKGAEALDLQGRGGRRSAFLSWEEEESLLADLREKATLGEFPISHGIRDKVEKQLRHPVSKDYAYDLLKRHGWRKIAPRPRHPRKNLAAQEEFKKKSRFLWKPPQRLSNRRTSGH